MITTDQVRQFVQSKEEAALGIITPPTLYYLQIFNTHGHKKFFLSWNWAAFSAAFLNVGHLWFAYRKMYVMAAAYWFLSNSLISALAILIKYNISYFTKLQGLTWALKIGYGIANLILSNCMGVFANALYFSRIRSSLKRNDSGGTSPTAVLCALIITISLSILIEYFARPYFKELLWRN